MIDAKSVVKEIIGEDPQPGNHSSFAIEYDTPDEVNHMVDRLMQAHFTIVREPWDVFWGQTLRDCRGS